MKKYVSLYVHIPFCVVKCKYCDFLSFDGESYGTMLRYVDCLCQEIKMYAPIVADYGVRSIFIGGGTPSLLDESLITNIMAFIRRYFHVEKNAEVTIEANPGTLRHQKLNGYKAAGINRISIGLQSCDGDIYDGNSIGGTDPVKITKEDVKEYKELNKKQGGGSGVGKVFGTIFKFIIFAAIVFGIYMFVTKVVLKPNGPETYEDAVKAFQTAVNEDDSEKLQALVPEYITANKALVEEILPYVQETNYTSIKIIDTSIWGTSEVNAFNDKIQLEHGKTADAREGVTLKLGLRGTMKDRNGVKRQYLEVNIDFIKIKGVWYPDIEEVQDQLFKQD